MKTETRKLVPLTLAELELIYAVLNHSLAHPCHKCLELESATNLINLHRLEMCVRKEPVKTIPSRKKTDFVMPEEPLTPSTWTKEEAKEVTNGVREMIAKEKDRIQFKEEQLSLLENSYGIKQASGSGVLSEGIEQMEKVGERTKRKYNKSKLNNLKPPFGLA